jgi:hypothetical protein
VIVVAALPRTALPDAVPNADLPALPDVAAHFAGVTDTAPGTDIAQIGRRAVHLAALERVVLPIAEARLDDGGARAGELRRYGHELSTALHWLDRHLTGDARVAGSPTHELSQAVRAATANYVKAEQALLSELASALDSHEIVNLIRAYHRSSLVAPTRGHPRLSYRGRRGWLAFKLAAFIDDVRDGTDNRPVRSDVWSAAAKTLHDLTALPVADSLARGIGSAPTPALAISRATLR